MKRFCTITVILGILVSMIVLPVNANNVNKWDGTSYDTQWEGNGTEEKPYLITSASQLYGLAKDVYDSLSTDTDVAPTDTEGVYTKYSDKYFKLTCDIDLGGHNWLPIGRVGMRFNGSFDGDGHTIKNLSISGTMYQGMGLFGATSEAVLIKNIGVDNVSFEYYADKDATVDYKTNADKSFEVVLDKGRPWGTAALIGVFDGGTIRNCYARNVEIQNTNTNTAPRNAGGLLGGAYSTTEHTDSTPTKEINITSCYVNNVVIEGEFFYSGAFFGSTRINDTKFLYGNIMKASHCYAVGSINTDSAFGDGRCSYSSFLHCYVTQEATRNTEATLTDKSGIVDALSQKAPGYSADNATTPINEGYPVLTWQNTWLDLWDGKTTDREWAGDGTQEHPYIIATAEELAGLAYNVNNAVPGDGKTMLTKRGDCYSVYKDTYFKLANDIDLTGSEWIPIGDKGINFFDGCFDGDSHVIKNLIVTKLNKRMALFGRTGANVTIKNLGLDGVTIEYTNDSSENRVVGAASLIAQAGGGRIENCYARNVRIINYATLTTEYAAGGLVAYCDSHEAYVDENSDIRFNNCYVKNVEITGSIYARHSGFFGCGYYAYTDYRRYPKFKNCCVIGEVSLSNGACYGFGRNDHENSVINCFSVSDAGTDDERYSLLACSDTLDEIKKEYSTIFLSIPHSWENQYKLPGTSVAGCPIAWSSSDTSVIGNDGTAYYAKEPRTAVLTATITSGEEQGTKRFEVTLPGKQVFDIQSAEFTNPDGTTSNSLSAGAKLTSVNVVQNYTAQKPKVWVGLYDAKSPDKKMKEVCMADAVPDANGRVTISNGFTLPETDINRYLVKVMIWSDYTPLCDNLDVFAPAVSTSRFTISGSSHAAFTQTPSFEYTVSTDDDVVWSIEGNVPRTVKMSNDGVLSLTEEIVDDTVITIKATLKDNRQISATKTVLLSTAEDYARDMARFNAAKTVLDNTLAYGRTSNSPLISNYINIKDKSIENYPAVNGDLQLTNLAMQFNLMTALSGMSNLTGDSKYQDAVDDIYSYHMENLLAPTNMFYWGGHCSLDMNTMKPEPYTYNSYGGLHELKDIVPYMEPFFRLYPEEAKKLAMGAWMGHIVDWSTFASNRHASLKYEKDSDIWDDVDNIEIEPGVVRWADACGFRAIICDIMNMAMDEYEATGDTIPLKWTYKMLQKYISTSYNYENGGRIFGAMINTAHNAPNVIDIEEKFGEDWWTDEKYDEVMSGAAYGDRYYNQFAQDLYEAGYIEEWEKEYIIEPYALFYGCEGVLLTMFAIRCAELIKDTHPEEASSLVDDMVQHLYQYYSLAYDWNRNWFPAMTVTGKTIEGFTPKRNGHYGKNPLTGLNPKYYHVLSAAMVYEAASKRPEIMEKYSKELAYIWDAARDMANDRLLVGDIGNPFTGEAPSLDMETTKSNPEYIRFLIKLYEISGNFDYLDCARQIADNIVKNNIKDGFMVQNSKQTVSLTGEDYVSEILYLESYLTGNEGAVPVTFLPSTQYYDGFVLLSDGTIELAGEKIFTKYDEYLE